MLYEVNNKLHEDVDDFMECVENSSYNSIVLSWAINYIEQSSSLPLTPLLGMLRLVYAHCT